MPDTSTIEPIGYIESPFTGKFAVPRQPGLVPAAEARLVLTGKYAAPDCVRGISEFSHLWVIFQFHQTRDQGWKPLVRPPRLGGNEKRGVFATRSTFRPNHLGLSVVELQQVIYQPQQTVLVVKGGDWVNQTPIIDIKPYVPFADCIPAATSQWAPTAPPASFSTVFTPQARHQLEELSLQYPHLETLICQVLAQDPRPAYQHQEAAGREYGMTLYDINIRWSVEGQQNQVINLTKGF